MSAFHVLYAADEKFAGILAASLSSLFEQHRHIEALQVHILGNGLSEKSRAMLLALAEAYHRTLHILPMPEIEQLTGLSVSCQEKITVTTYYRLFTAQMLPDVDRILYLDCDTMICQPLDGLFEIPLQHSCAAVCEPWSAAMKRRIGLAAGEDVFNAGVLLLDLAAWRREKLVEQFQTFLQQQKGQVFFEDQGVLNHVLRGRIDKLPLEYNVQTPYYAFGFKGVQLACGCRLSYPEAEFQRAVEKPKIVHFTNCYVEARPWVEGSRHPFAKQWLAYKQSTPWRDAPLWPDKKDWTREICKRIYRLLPGNGKYRFTYLVNGVVRPMLKGS